MSATEELFPDATPHDPGNAVDTAPGETASRRLGIAALILGAFAIASDVGGALAALAVIATVVMSVDSGAGLSGIDWAIGYEIAVGIVGFIAGAAALVLGIRAARARRGRSFGIVGAVLGAASIAFVTLVIAGAVVAVAASMPGG